MKSTTYKLYKDRRWKHAIIPSKYTDDAQLSQR